MPTSISLYFNDSYNSITPSNLTKELFNSTTMEPSSDRFACNVQSYKTGKNRVQSFFKSMMIDHICNQAFETVVKQWYETNGQDKITLNLYGHGTGAVTALLLAKKLSKAPPHLLTINLALLHPTPEDPIIVSILDPFKGCLANKAMDLTHCKPLKNVLAIYANESRTNEAPVFPSYPSDTHVDEEVLPGTRSSLASTDNSPTSELVKFRIKRFLTKHGTQFTNEDENVTKQREIALYESVYSKLDNSSHKKKSNTVHSTRRLIITSEPNEPYRLNNQHRNLDMGNEAANSVALSIQPEKGLFARLKQFCIKHPLVIQTIYWALLTLALVGALYLSGGLIVIPSFIVLAKFSILITAAYAAMSALLCLFALEKITISLTNHISSWGSIFVKAKTIALDPIKDEAESSMSSDLDSTQTIGKALQGTNPATTPTNNATEQESDEDDEEEERETRCLTRNHVSPEPEEVEQPQYKIITSTTNTSVFRKAY